MKILKKILITGSAGFIGFHLSKELLEKGHLVIGVDNFNDYYDVKLKEDRNKILEKYSNFKLLRGDLSDNDFVSKLFSKYEISTVYHLAAQPGVQYSKKNPQTYIKSNINAFVNILEEIRKKGIKKLVFASSSTVYGGSSDTPYSPQTDTNKPISLYAATKKADELLAYTYHHLYGINVTCLRPFTVIGPYGRPDMAIMTFAKSILNNEKIKIFNFGKIKRAFTFIDDVVSAFIKAMDKCNGYNIYNVGSEKSHELDYFISLLEEGFEKKANKEYVEAVSGDMPITKADISKTIKDLNWYPKNNLEESVSKFIDWYKSYYINNKIL
jgi:UDP-glucuronate 4-epimerase